MMDGYGWMDGCMVTRKLLPISSSSALSCSSRISDSRTRLIIRQLLLLCRIMPTPGHLLSLLLVWIPCTCSCFALSAASVEPFPSSQSSVVKQAAAAITRAYQDGKINKQTVRLPLSDAMYSDKEEGFVATRAIGWQGGPQETIRFLAPISSSVLRGIKTTGDENTGGLVARVSEQILLDYDGSVLQTAEHPAGAIYDIQALLQANTDNYYLDTIQKIEEQFSDTPGKKAKRLFLLVNPAWRDRSSWGFFGGQRAQELILDRYETTYAVDEFIVANERVGLLRCWPDDWAVYIATKEKKDDPTNMEVMSSLIATFEERPEYKQIEKALKIYRRKDL